MSTVKINTQVIMAFADESSRTYTLPDTPESVTASMIETRIQAINNNTSTRATNFRQTFLSTGGASFVSISGGRRITTTEEELYNG